METGRTRDFIPAIPDSGGVHALRPLRTMNRSHPGFVPNLLYRIRTLKVIIGDMGDKLQDVQTRLPEGDPMVGEIGKFLEEIANEVNSLGSVPDEG